MKTPKHLSIGSPKQGKEFQYLKSLDIELRKLLTKINTDFIQGNARLEIYEETSTPELSDGQRIIVEKNNEYFLRTSIDGKEYETKLEEV